MLELQAEQLEALERLDRERFARALAPALAELWPAVAARVGARQTEFVVAGLAAAAREGLQTPFGSAGLVNLWYVWGPAFETRPGFEWAREILDAKTRRPIVRLHQLLQASRERLQRPQSAGAPSGVAGATLAQFDAAWARLPALAEAAACQGVFVPSVDAEALPAACDLAGAELSVAGTEWRQEYRPAEGGWRRQPAPPAAASLRVDAPAAAPLVIAALGPPTRATPVSQLRLRLQPLAQCDAARHPALTLDSPQGRLQWQGRDALALSQPLLGPPPSSSGLAAIGADVEPVRERLAIETCGVRDAGEPIGPVSVEVQVYPAAQVLLECRVAPLAPLVLPSRDPAAAPAPATCRVECDGDARDARAWTAAWQALQQRVGQGMEQLLNAWARVAAVDQARLEATLSALAGLSTLTWGYREEGASNAFMRLEGQLDVVACAVELTLTGELSDGPARARLRLRAQGRSELRSRIARLASTTALDAALEPALAQWRFPLVIDLEPVAGAEMASLVEEGPALPGALVGSAGLRPRGDGGCEWFFSLRLEPSSIGTMRIDPVTGSSSRSRALVPALVLVEWSSG